MAPVTFAPAGAMTPSAEFLCFLVGVSNKCCLLTFLVIHEYSKFPKILYTKVSDKIAYAISMDPDQTAFEGAV